MDEIIIKRKRIILIPIIIETGALVIGFIVVAFIISSIGYKIACIISAMFFLMALCFFVIELFKEVRICGNSIYIRYGRKYSSYRIITCEFHRKESISGHSKRDTITLRYDDFNDFIIDSFNCTNYDALLEYIVRNDIPVITDQQSAFNEVKNAVKNKMQG